MAACRKCNGGGRVKGEPCESCSGTGAAKRKSAVKVKDTRYDFPADPEARAYADAYLAGAEGHRRRLEALQVPVPKSFTTLPGKLTKPTETDRNHSNQIRLNLLHPLLIEEVE